MSEYARPTVTAVPDAEREALLSGWISGQAGDSRCPLCRSDRIAALDFSQERQPRKQLVCRSCGAEGRKVCLGEALPDAAWQR